MSRALLRPALVLSVLVASGTSLLTVPSSPCASLCGNTSSTTGSEIVCSDTDFETTEAGFQFEECITCQLNSTTVDTSTGISDTQWLLYNLRFAMSYCVWGYPDNSDASNTPCITEPACGTLTSNIQYQNLSTNVTEYGYCANINTAAFSKCNACLENVGTQYYMNNFFTAIVAGCEEQPPAGSTLSLSGSLFSTTPVNITTASSIPTYNTGSGGLTQTDEIGIAVGCIVFALMAAGFTIVCLGKRRRRRELKEMQENERNGGDYINTLSPPTSIGWQGHGGGHYPQYMDESPMSATGMGGHMWSSPIEKQQVFSPYHSHYSSPVDDPNAAQWGHGGIQYPPAAYGLGISNDNKNDPERNRDPDAIEMHSMSPGGSAHLDLLREAASHGFTTNTAPMLSRPVPPQRFAGPAHDDSGTPGKAI